jgi:hypothetical protein
LLDTAATCAAEADKILAWTTGGAEIYKRSINQKSPYSSLGLEALTFGLAYGAGLCWASVCLVGSFRDSELSTPYWAGIPGLRTDTCGEAAFLVLAVCFATSEYLRLNRRRDDAARSAQQSLSSKTALLAVAIAKTITVLATGVVVYLSVNAVTHPATLALHLTHLAPWPAEGTVRVIALLLCVCAGSTLRFLLAGSAAAKTADR